MHHRVAESTLPVDDLASRRYSFGSMLRGNATHYLDQAIILASNFGLFDHPQVRLKLDPNKLPEWLRRFQLERGFDQFEAEHAIAIPAALREFWSRPDLVCAWTVAGVDALGSTPTVTDWIGETRFLTFELHSHIGCAAAVRLDGSDNPPVVREFEPEKVWSETFSGYLQEGFNQYAQHTGRA